MESSSPVGYRLTRGRRLGNALLGVLIRFGLLPHRSQLLTTVGRRSGASHTTPVTLVSLDGAEYLVAPYGPVAWVHNARAAGVVTLRHGRVVRRMRVREVEASEAGPVLARYVELAPTARSSFAAAPGAAVSAFAAEADRHPVFALTPHPE